MQKLVITRELAEKGRQNRKKCIQTEIHIGRYLERQADRVAAAMYVKRYRCEKLSLSSHPSAAEDAC